MAAAQAIALRFRSWFRSRRTEDGGDTAAVITEAIKIPRGLQGYVAIELLDEQLLIIYVTKEHRHAAEFESLIEWLRSRDYPPPEIRIATLDAVHAMKKRSQTTARTVPAQRKVLAILKAAAARGASDIHFRQYPNNQAGYELRINGRMTAAIEYFTKADLRKLLQALYGITDPNSRSRIGSYLEDQSIDAAIIERLADLHLDDLYSAIRLKFVPAFFGPECAVRLQPRRNTPLTLSTLGLSVRDRDMLLTMLSQPNGAIYISGPVNSGKSQLLIMLGAEHHQRFPWRRIVTIEDPVEAPIPGATQLVFNAANPAEREQEVKSRLRDMVRLDYDLGILGENRDSETAQLFSMLTLSGRLGLSTIHTDFAISIIEKLAEWGVGPGVLKNQKRIIGLLAVRLAEKLCDDCKIPLRDALAISGYEAQELQGTISRMQRAVIDAAQLRGATPADITTGFIRNHQGCATCQIKDAFTHGTVGRLLVAEVIRPDVRLLELLVATDIAGAETHLRTVLRTPTIQEDAARRIADGLLCPLDAESLLGSFEPAERHEPVHIIARRAEAP